MADLVRKTQFEKICPFKILSQVMLTLKELQTLHKTTPLDELIDEEIYADACRLANPAFVAMDQYLLACRLAAKAILLAQKTGVVKPDS